MIRNEQSVEIIKLRKNLEAKLSSPSKVSRLRSKENYKAFSANDKFIENEVERQRRALIEENELLKKRLRASDTIANSSNHDRAKFMEGASWIIKKAHFETEKHIHNL